MFDIKTVEIELGGKTLKLETGRVARQANGAVLATLGAAAWSWRDDVERLWDQMPVVARAVADSVKKAARQPAGSMAEVTKAAAEIEAVAQTGKANPPPAKPAPAPSGKPFWTKVWEGGQTVALQ